MLLQACMCRYLPVKKIYARHGVAADEGCAGDVQGLRNTDIMLLKRARRKDKAKAEESSSDSAHHHEALPSHEPVISRWSGASCLAFQPSTDYQRYLVGELKNRTLTSTDDANESLGLSA